MEIGLGADGPIEVLVEEAGFFSRIGQHSVLAQHVVEPTRTGPWRAHHEEGRQQLSAIDGGTTWEGPTPRSADWALPELLKHFDRLTTLRCPF